MLIEKVNYGHFHTFSAPEHVKIKLYALALGEHHKNFLVARL